MIRRMMHPGGVVFLAFLVFWGVEAARGMGMFYGTNTIDYLRTADLGYTSRPCITFNPFDVCRTPVNCKAANQTHFTCDCKNTEDLTARCFGTHTDPCKLSPCKNGQCMPFAKFTAAYRCYCRPGYFGTLCEYGPLTKCAYHVGGIVPIFTTYFPSLDRKQSDFAGLKDMCLSKGLVLIKNPRDHCLLQYYSMVSGAIGDHKGFVYLGYNGPLYVSIHARYPISYPYQNGFSELIAEQKRVGFSIIQICMQPPNIQGYLVVPQVVPYKSVMAACRVLGLPSYHLAPGITSTGANAALDYMVKTYYKYGLYYSLLMGPNGYIQATYLVVIGSVQVRVAGFPSGSKNTVAVCKAVGPCSLYPCGQHATNCIDTSWGFHCICKGGFTGATCSTDMAAYRVQCGAYYLYTLANTALFKNQVAPVTAVADKCRDQSSTLPPEPVSQCELDFYRTVSKRFFNSSSYMYYTARDQRMAFATNAKQVSYSFLDRFSVHLQSIICHGSGESFFYWILPKKGIII